jgi:lysine 2,3-aminomutase
MDATEILKSNAAAVAAADAAWVNPRDPAKAVGADGQPLRSRRAPKWADVPNEQWDDWRWQLSNRVNSLEEIGEILELTDDEREGLSADGKFRVDITP